MRSLKSHFNFWRTSDLLCIAFVKLFIVSLVAMIIMIARFCPKNILQPILQISWICLQKCQVITVQCSCLCVTHVSDMRTFLFFFTWCLTLKNTACYSKVLISLPSKYSKKETNLFFLIFNVNISNIYLRTNSKLSDLVFTS